MASAVESAIDYLGRSLPRGTPLPPDVWRGRHRGFLLFLWLQALGLAVFGVARGYGVLHSVLEAGVVAVFAALAWLPQRSRRFRSIAATLGLMTASGILVHLSGGVIEAHFHFFVMVSLITLYQDWIPFLLSIGYVVFHHGVMGTIDPMSVYNHPAAIASPFEWAFIHGFFILGASIAGLIVWRRNEDLREKEAERLSAAAQARRQQVLNWNDSVVQGLAIAKMASEMGDDARSSEALAITLGRAQEIISSLLDDMIEDGMLVPGTLVLDGNPGAERVKDSA